MLAGVIGRVGVGGVVIARAVLGRCVGLVVAVAGDHLLTDHRVAALGTRRRGELAVGDQPAVRSVSRPVSRNSVRTVCDTVVAASRAPVVDTSNAPVRGRGHSRSRRGA